MSKNNSSDVGCFIRTLIYAVLIALMVSFCKRQVTDKSFIDNSIEQVHQWTNHVDSVWKGGNK